MPKRLGEQLQKAGGAPVPRDEWEGWSRGPWNGRGYSKGSQAGFRFGVEMLDRHLFGVGRILVDPRHDELCRSRARISLGEFPRDLLRSGRRVSNQSSWASSSESPWPERAAVTAALAFILTGKWLLSGKSVGVK